MFDALVQKMKARFDTCTVIGQEGYIFLAVIKKYILHSYLLV